MNYIITSAKYYEKVQSLKTKFTTFELTHVPREQNGRTDILAKLDNTKKPGTIKKPNDTLLSISDDYIITFPKNSEPEEKLLLTVVGLMIDYQYFEKKGNAASKY